LDRAQRDTYDQGNNQHQSQQVKALWHVSVLMSGTVLWMTAMSCGIQHLLSPNSIPCGPQEMVAVGYYITPAPLVNRRIFEIQSSLSRL
jgi:hypothetical protein